MVGGLAVVVISVAATQLTIDCVAALPVDKVRVGRNGPTLRQIRRLGGQYSVPAEWYAIPVALKQRNPVDWLSDSGGTGCFPTLKAFLCWGSTAHLLGWTSLDLFGVHPIAPAVRFDVMGLISTLNGADVLTLTNQTATMRRTSGAVVTYRRPEQGGAVLLSQADANRISSSASS